MPLCRAHMPLCRYARMPLIGSALPLPQPRSRRCFPSNQLNRFIPHKRTNENWPIHICVNGAELLGIHLASHPEMTGISPVKLQNFVIVG